MLDAISQLTRVDPAIIKTLTGYVNQASGTPKQRKKIIMSMRFFGAELTLALHERQR